MTDFGGGADVLEECLFDKAATALGRELSILLRAVMVKARIGNPCN